MTAALASALMPTALQAQDDPDEIPLGDVARNLRKNALPAKPVIDDDNLSEVMAQADSRQNASSNLRYVISGASKGFQASIPDVTCSLAFTANVKLLLAAPQYSEMNLPGSDLAQLEGPAVIEGDALTVTLFNASYWHVSEISVAFTLIKKASEGTASEIGAESAIQELRPEKKQDTTVIYKMRAAAPPWMRAGFSTQLNVDVQPGDEWHWAIVEAKGYPPQTGSSAAAASVNDGRSIDQAAAVAVAPTNGQPGLAAHSQPQ
jgi:hypothetical protein